jgi:hypothetical protein
METIEKKILEELIYERVRLTLDLCELLDFEADLTRSIERALDSCAGTPADKGQLTLTYLHRAWERLGREALQAMATGGDVR